MKKGCEKKWRRKKEAQLNQGEEEEEEEVVGSDPKSEEEEEVGFKERGTLHDVGLKWWDWSGLGQIINRNKRNSRGRGLGVSWVGVKKVNWKMENGKFLESTNAFWCLLIYKMANLIHFIRNFFFFFWRNILFGIFKNTLYKIYLFVVLFIFIIIYMHPVRNPGTVHRHTPVPEYSVPMANPKRPLERNSKLCC